MSNENTNPAPAAPALSSTPKPAPAAASASETAAAAPVEAVAAAAAPAATKVPVATKAMLEAHMASATALQDAITKFAGELGNAQDLHMIQIVVGGAGSRIAEAQRYLSQKHRVAKE